MIKLQYNSIKYFKKTILRIDNKIYNVIIELCGIKIDPIEQFSICPPGRMHRCHQLFII